MFTFARTQVLKMTGANTPLIPFYWSIILVMTTQQIKPYLAKSISPLNFNTETVARIRLLSKSRRRLLALTLAPLLLLTTNHLAYALDYYVDGTEGNDTNPGTITLPWKTMSKVESSAGSGDRVYFQRGEIWNEWLDIPASNMVFDAYGTGPKPIIDGENTGQHAFLAIGKHDIEIRNFNIKNVVLCGIQFNTVDSNVSYNISVINNDFSDMGSMGVRTYSPHDVQLDGHIPYGITIMGNSFTDLGNFAIGLKATDTAPNIISENIVIRAGNGVNQTNALQLSAKGLIVEKNLIIDTKGGPNGDGHSIIVDWSVEGRIETMSEDVTVRYNYVSGANTANEQAGIHVYYGKNSRIYGNVSVNNTIGYKLTNDVSTGNVFYNNVAYSNTRSGALIGSTAPVSVWKNNIFYGVNNGDIGMLIYGESPIESNNLFYNFSEEFKDYSAAAVSIDPSDLITDSLFQDVLINDFSLKSDSPAVNAGTDLTDIVTDLIMPGSVWPDNIALINQSVNGVWEIGAHGYRDVNSTNRHPTLPILAYPANNETGLATTVDFVWERSADPDADPVAHSLSYCADSNFTNCYPVEVAMHSGGVLFSGPVAILVFGTTFIGGISRRKLPAPFLATILLLLSSPLISCSESSNVSTNSESGEAPTSEITYSVSNLEPGTTYYWKVSAEDANGEKTQSVVWSFTTQ